MTTTASRPLALVTGASSGIGLELAKQFAQHGFNLILAAEDDELSAAAREVESLGAQVDAVRTDLATEQGVEELYRHVREASSPLQAAALNAGIGAGGAFANGTELEQELRMVDLNVRSTVQLAKYVLRDMVTRGHGRVLFTSSIASTMPGPYAAVYNASKSFVQSFGLALRSELKGTGVSVTLLMPGPTNTEFFDRAHLSGTKLANMYRDDPVDVAKDGFQALMDGRERVISHSLVTKVQGRSNRLLPDSVKAQMHRMLARR